MSGLRPIVRDHVSVREFLGKFRIRAQVPDCWGLCRMAQNFSWPRAI
jgi:hypothetical protein